MRSFGSLTFLCSYISLARAIVIDSPFIGNSRVTSSQAHHGRQQSICQPFSSTFSQSDVSRSPYTPFVGVSPPETYETTGDGLKMFLDRPEGPITRHGHVNNVVGEGATINSTFPILYGRVTFEAKAPEVAGVVTAAILISDGHNEIDVELLGGDPRRWQTNVYAPSPRDEEPLWGVLGELDHFRSSSSISQYHNYTIDWNADRIIWSVDDHEVRTLKPSQTKINGTEHYPRQASRIQLGIWDASNPEGTSEWAKGPIDWKNAPSPISATVKSVQIECD